jgi:hypothetical protein
MKKQSKPMIIEECGNITPEQIEELQRMWKDNKVHANMTWIMGTSNIEDNEEDTIKSK